MDLAAQVGAAINTWLEGTARAALGPALETAGALIVATPQLDAAPSVVASWHVMQVLANALVVLAWIACGVLVMSGAGNGRYAAKVLIPRVAFAALAANVSLAAAGALIALNNALVASVLGQPAAAVSALLSVITLPASTHDVLGVALALATAVIGVVLVAVAVIRDLVLIVATAVAPLALVTYALPQTDAIARGWTRLFVALLYVQILQVVVLEIGGAILRAADPALLPSSGLVSGVLAVTLVFVLARLPLVAVGVALQGSVTVVPFAQPVLLGLRALRAG